MEKMRNPNKRQATINHSTTTNKTMRIRIETSHRTHRTRLAYTAANKKCRIIIPINRRASKQQRVIRKQGLTAIIHQPAHKK